MPRELFSPWIYFTLRNLFMLLRIKTRNMVYILLLQDIIKKVTKEEKR